MKSTARGQNAETAAAQHLEGSGWEILERNWRTKLCEIDIIAKKANAIYFVEVKYRSSSAQGDGLAYIAGKKLKQMHFAAQIWLQHSGWEGDWRLMAASISPDGQQYRVDALIELY